MIQCFPCLRQRHFNRWENAIYAFGYAADLAKKFNARITTLYVKETMNYAAETDGRSSKTCLPRQTIQVCPRCARTILSDFL